RVAGLRNARLVQAATVARHLATIRPERTVGDLLEAAASVETGIDPEDVRTCDPRYEAVVEFSEDAPELMDVTFRHRLKQPCLSREQRASSGPIARFANVPVRPADATTALIPALRDRARQKLPEFMVPSAFVLMEALPLTPNGKIDRRALPAPEQPRAESAKYEPPRNDVERGIVGVLRELLGVGDVSVDDNFFDLGANSLMLVQASVRLRSFLARPVPLVKMFQHPTAR